MKQRELVITAHRYKQLCCNVIRYVGIFPWCEEVLWISVLWGMYCQKAGTELCHCRTKRCCIFVYFDIECVLFFFCQEIAVLKGRNWALKGTLLMIATLKSSPEGDLFGRKKILLFINVSLPIVKIPCSSPRPSLQYIIYKSNSLSPFFSGFCTLSCSSTMMAQTTVYLTKRRKTNWKSNLTSHFTSTSGGSVGCFLSHCS